ncbi:MAG: hypothetical protein ACYCZX_03890 [Rhodospirillaceae bacterium]
MKQSIPGVPQALFAAALAATLAYSAPAAAEPRCAVLQFLDAKGVVIATLAPIVGMLVGDKPVYDGSVPVAASIKPGAETACPPALVAGVRSTFEAACVSEQRRTQAAKDHKVDRKVIDKGCADMMKSLGTDLVAPK